MTDSDRSKNGDRCKLMHSYQEKEKTENCPDFNSVGHNSAAGGPASASFAENYKLTGRRTNFSSLQRHILEEAFKHSQYATKTRLTTLSHQLELSSETVRVWFKNRRVKWRKGFTGTLPEPTCGTYKDNYSRHAIGYDHHVIMPQYNLHPLARDARFFSGLTYCCSGQPVMCPSAGHNKEVFKCKLARQGSGAMFETGFS